MITVAYTDLSDDEFDVANMFKHQLKFIYDPVVAITHAQYEHMLDNALAATTNVLGKGYPGTTVPMNIMSWYKWSFWGDFLFIDTRSNAMLVKLALDLNS